MLGGYAMSAMTSVTVQDTQRVHKIYDMPGSLVADQIRVVLNDIGADAIKIGMLSSSEIVEAVAGILSEYPYIPRIIDPVMLSTSGTRLLSPNGTKLLIKNLLPGSIVTPNVPEAESLTMTSITSVETMVEAGQKLVQMGAKAALIKGGHLLGETLHDVLVEDGGIHIFDQLWIESQHTHGTGCVLASALAFFIAEGRSLPDAVSYAGQYVHRAILNAPGLGKGNGPIGHLLCS